MTRTLPVLTVTLVLFVLWYAGAIVLNGPQVTSMLERSGSAWTTADFIRECWNMGRAVLPTPHQIVIDLFHSLFDYSPTNPRNILFHAYVTASSTLVGFIVGLVVGAVLAVGIVHMRTLESSLMPWVIMSQTVPILAIAPMLIVILGNMGFTGVVPKAMISAYLSFFPITIGLVKGLRSIDPLQLDLMRTYSATQSQVFWKLRLPASLPFLFTSLKVAVAISLVGAIVAELPTGAVAGLGARLLTGSYYGQMVQIWSTLVVAAVLSLALVWAVGAVQRATVAQSKAPS
ncbi:MAG TPA: ABC transporter permease [Magnetospirillaceae bacterium]|jgi:NitT/TauT family transport system permease protein